MIKIMEIQRNEKIRELATLALLQDLWLTFYENVKLSDKGDVQTVDEVAGYVDFRQDINSWLSLDAGVRIDHHSHVARNGFPKGDWLSICRGRQN